MPRPKAKRGCDGVLVVGVGGGVGVDGGVGGGVVAVEVVVQGVIGELKGLQRRVRACGEGREDVRG